VVGSAGNKANSAPLELELWLSLGTIIILWFAAALPLPLCGVLRVFLI